VSKTNKDKIPVLLPSGKREDNFFELVHQVARAIPKGRVTSYGAIAAFLGAKSSARMVGWAMNGAHTAKPKVPAHRVVNRRGMLTGKMHFSDPGKMQQLLEKEGIKVEGDMVINFQHYFWDPAQELK
jgi:methylated-DNA-protein-cysteine methyltransferase-like protein